jgi:hypothetical protein
MKTGSIIIPKGLITLLRIRAMMEDGNFQKAKAVTIG